MEHRLFDITHSYRFQKRYLRFVLLELLKTKKL